MELINKIPNLNRSQNLPPAPEPSLPEASGLSAPRKLIVFHTLAILLAGAVGYGCLLYFSGGANSAMLAIVAALFLTASFFDFLFTKDRKRRMIVVLLQIAVFLGFFYAVKPSAVLSAFGILVLFHFIAQKAADGIMQNSLKFKLGPTARTYMKKIFLGFALAAIVLYLPQWNTGNVFVPQPKFQKWYDGFASISQRFYAGPDLNSNVGVFAENVVRAQLSSNAQFKSLPPQAQEEAVEKASQELVANISKNMGLQLVPSMPLAEAFYEYILNFLNNLKTQFGDSFLAAWAVALFVLAWSVGTLLMWLVVLVTYLIFEMFSAFNILHVAGESRTKEIVELS